MYNKMKRTAVKKSPLSYIQGNNHQEMFCQKSVIAGAKFARYSGK